MRFNFRKNQSGAIGLLLALAAVPLVLAAGVAVDFGRMIQAKSQLQSALDAGALAVASSKTAEAGRIKLGKDVYRSNAGELGLGIEPTFSIQDGKVIANVSIQFPMSLTKIAGIETSAIGVSSQVNIPNQRPAEVALVLDYSSSMNSRGKWKAMRDAALDLVNVVSEQQTRTDIKVGLVPFAKMVAADLPAQYVIEETPSSPWTGSGCTQDRKWPYNTQDATPSSLNDDTKWGALGQAKGTCNQLLSRNLKIMPLTDDLGAVTSKLNSMTPHVGTHISLGLEFGWHLISPNPPFTEGTSYGDPDVLKVIVLLTDGEQTTKAWGPGGSYTPENGEQNLEAMCTAIKGNDVLMVTVAFDLESGSSRARLKTCATSPNYFFEAKSNAQLAAAFSEIAGLIKGKTYLSQ